MGAKTDNGWRKVEESNPIPVRRTRFSRPVAGPTPLHNFPRTGESMECATGIEPAYFGLQPNARPLGYAHVDHFDQGTGAGHRNRTDIHSLEGWRLTTRPGPQKVVPQARLELAKARLLKPVGVPISIATGGISKSGRGWTIRTSECRGQSAMP